jgi:hypothetical protein
MMRLDIQAKAGRRTFVSTYWLTIRLTGKQAPAGSGSDQTIGNVTRKLIACDFPDQTNDRGALAIIFLATVAGFLAIIAGGEI